MINLNFIKNLLLTILLIAANITNGQTITTIAGNGVDGFLGDWGPPTAAELNVPGYISFGFNDGFGSLYVADGSNNRVRQIKLGGIIYTIAGNGMAGYFGDGGQATAAKIYNPGGMITDKYHNVYFTENDNQIVRKINSLGIISTYAGTSGSTGFSGDGGQATNAQFNRPYCVDIDKTGNIYVADQYNHCIRKIDTNGIISTVAGTPGITGYSGNGGNATNATISYPNYVRTDTLGNFYITDNGNHCIRKVNSSGIITTVAGNGTQGFSGDGGLAINAQLNYPGGVQWDSYGNMYIADAFNYRVRMVNAETGHINTVAGNGSIGYSGDNGPATTASLNEPCDIAIDNHNNIYIADRNNNVIRKIDELYPTTAFQTVENKLQTFQFYPNPTIGIIEFEWNYLETGNSSLFISDILGRVVYESEINIVSNYGKKKIDVSKLGNGMYLLTFQTKNASFTNSIIIAK